MDGINDELKALLTNGDVPQRVTNRLLFAKLLDLEKRIDANTAGLSEIGDRLECVERQELESPSVIHLLKTRPRQTITTLVVLFLFLMAAYGAGLLPALAR